METKKQTQNENKVIANQLRDLVLDQQTHKYFEKHQPKCKYGMMCTCQRIKITFTQLRGVQHQIVHTLTNQEYKLYLIEKGEVIG